MNVCDKQWPSTEGALTAVLIKLLPTYTQHSIRGRLFRSLRNDDVGRIHVATVYKRQQRSLIPAQWPPPNNANMCLCVRRVHCIIIANSSRVCICGSQPTFFAPCSLMCQIIKKNMNVTPAQSLDANAPVLVSRGWNRHPVTARPSPTN